MSPTPGKPMQTGPNAQHVAANVRRIRTARGLSTNQLSALLAKAGHPIAQSSISNIEAGRRRVDVDDLVALSVALGVAPNTLLLPDTVEGSADLTGGGTVHARTAHEWADRRRPLRIPDGDDGETEVDFERLAKPRGYRSWNIASTAGLAAAQEAIRDMEPTKTGFPRWGRIEHDRPVSPPLTREQAEEALRSLDEAAATRQHGKDAELWHACGCTTGPQSSPTAIPSSGPRKPAAHRPAGGKSAGMTSPAS